MISVKDIRLIAVISVGIVLGNGISCSGIFSLPKSLYRYCSNWYKEYIFQSKYQKYLSDNDKIVPIERNVLILCHGRKYPVVHTDLLDYQKR